ncbi:MULTISPECIES: HNH endonuclease [unclassified Pseudomonas]|uniref:HNH endonuclease n=1 Tax=unclassified Pseudomonas TaxID=196821 RepID=UPI0012F93033|nr:MULTISPECIES: HNH endonuclease signature motif containing protein [unclassified Pseudomonas]MBD9545246.1 HNH endonuclease [Pseudomonas sp. PDM01]
MKADHIGVFYEGNSRLEAQELARAVEDWRHTPKQRQQAKRWAGSALQFEGIVQKALKEKLLIRGVIVARQDSNAVLGLFERWDARYRELDAEVWHIESYELETGHYIVRRGPRPQLAPMAVSTDHHQSNDVLINHEASKHPTQEKFLVADQFTGTDRPTQYERNGLVYERLAKVRNHVLQRAKGRCELISCGAAGFRKINDEIYLETHHASPLCEGGPDTPANVIALCPNHHREAHYGVNRQRLYEEALRSIAAAEALTQYPPT